MRSGIINSNIVNFQKGTYFCLKDNDRSKLSDILALRDDLDLNLTDFIVIRWNNSRLTTIYPGVF